MSESARPLMRRKERRSQGSAERRSRSHRMISTTFRSLIQRPTRAPSSRRRRDRTPSLQLCQPWSVRLLRRTLTRRSSSITCRRHRLTTTAITPQTMRPSMICLTRSTSPLTTLSMECHQSTTSQRETLSLRRLQLLVLQPRIERLERKPT